MPRYFFHVFNDQETTDFEGKELLDLEAARAVAIKGARGIMAHELETEGCINLNHWIEIEDERGEMTVLTFGDALTVRAVFV